MLFFTQKESVFGNVFMKFQKAQKRPVVIQNLINIEQDDKVKAFICTQDLKDENYINSHYVIMATKKGQVKML